MAKENKDYFVKTSEIESQIKTLNQKGITEFCIHDSEIAKNKGKILNILKLFLQEAPEVFISLYIEAEILDKEIIALASNLFISFEIPLKCSQKGDKLLFDKKFYANKAILLNNAGLIFGFSLTYGLNSGDSLKNYLERLDFAVQQYPNHIDFPQTEANVEDSDLVAKVSGIFSAKDIRRARDISFACRTFYSSGRAVSWFLSVLKPLKIYPSRFFEDFAEWQLCNNCDYKSGFIPENENHLSIEKMQLLFLEQKYEEKNCHQQTTAVQDIVRINGAFSRLVGDNQESTIETSYNPDDLFSEEVFDIVAFSENVCMEHCKTKLFFNKGEPDYQIL
ncbi:MAG: hypothetical protein J6C25_01740 [Treponema sp.]|nr:hypothetical protein [Treponema sp.]